MLPDRISRIEIEGNFVLMPIQRRRRVPVAPAFRDNIEHLVGFVHAINPRLGFEALTANTGRLSIFFGNVALPVMGLEQQ